MKKSISNFVKLIHILNDGQYHDGTTLGEKLNTTRSAVWKAIKKLKDYGIKVASVQSKGYVLLEPLILLDQKKIKREIPKDIDIHCLETIDSTNLYLKKLPNNNRITICLAEQQTDGKGRLNRNWHSPFAENIYFSCRYPFQKDISELAGLSLIISLAVVATLETFSLADRVLVKWPNDVIYNRQKISGNIIELQAESYGWAQAIIGIGINVNMLNDEDQEIGQPWTSLRSITGMYIDRNQLCVVLIQNLIKYLQLFEREGFAYFIHQWKDIDYLHNQEITLTNNGEKIRGQARGIDPQGYLILELGDGSLKKIAAGDTSILK